MYSSTTLEGPSKSGCWKQVDYAESNIPSLFPLEYRSYFGQAAHAVLQYCAEQRADTEETIRAVAEEVGNTLIREGREFRGRMEPPLPPDDVWAGVDVAVAYLMARGLPLEADVILPERDWDHPTLPYRALIDLVSVQEEGDEEYSQRVLGVTDYKTSWQVDADELNTLQRWGQAVVMWRQSHSKLPNDDPLQVFGENFEIDIIRQSVVNLRTWAEYTRDIHLDDPDEVAELEKWEKRIGALCETAEKTKRENPDGWPGIMRPANPGVGCLSCAWRHVCEDCTELDQGQAWTPESAAHDLAMIEAQRSLVIKAIKASDPDGPITIEGGWVGFKKQAQRIFKEGSERGILDQWLLSCACELPEEDKPVLVSLLSALKIGKSNVDALAKKLMPERKKGIVQARAEYVESLTVEKRSAQFGVWKDE